MGTVRVATRQRNGFRPLFLVDEVVRKGVVYLSEADEYRT
jgi:hypothetical protein